MNTSDELYQEVKNNIRRAVLNQDCKLLESTLGNIKYKVYDEIGKEIDFDDYNGTGEFYEQFQEMLFGIS